MKLKLTRWGACIEMCNVWRSRMIMWNIESFTVQQQLKQREPAQMLCTFLRLLLPISLFQRWKLKETHYFLPIQCELSVHFSLCLSLDVVWFDSQIFAFMIRHFLWEKLKLKLEVSNEMFPSDFLSVSDEQNSILMTFHLSTARDSWRSASSGHKLEQLDFYSSKLWSFEAVEVAVCATIKKLWKTINKRAS